MLSSMLTLQSVICYPIFILIYIFLIASKTIIFSYIYQLFKFPFLWILFSTAIIFLLFWKILLWCNLAIYSDPSSSILMYLFSCELCLICYFNHSWILSIQLPFILFRSYFTYKSLYFSVIVYYFIIVYVPSFSSLIIKSYYFVVSFPFFYYIKVLLCLLILSFMVNNFILYLKKNL